MAVESVITVAPTMLRMKVGEIRQVQIITKYTNIKVTAEPSGVVEYDSIHREFKAVARGYVNIRFDAYDEKGDNVGYDYINASVSTETTKAPVRYMWHNRATNRLVTLTGNLNEDDNLIFKLPKKSGTLLTDTGMEIVSNNIVTPTILSPATGVTDYDGMITASPFELHIAIQTEKHIATTWQYSLVEDFSTILKEEYIYGTANNQLTTTSMSYYGITTYVRVKYHSKIGTSEYSKPIKITWTTDSPELNNNALVAGDVNTAAYFGSVDTATYIDNRDYRGNYLTLLNNNLKTCNQGAQVHLDDTLYYAKKTLDATKFAKSPGSTDGATYWEVDARDSLPTVRWLMDRVGIGLGNTDNNLDTYTSDGTKIGEQINKDDNPWLKFIVNGKLIYTPVSSS